MPICSFDLDADPRELTNLATNPAHADQVAELRAEIARTWDLPSLDGAVRDSQRRRRIVDAALGTGRVTAWDIQPSVDATKQYVRNTLALDELETRARFPRAGS